MSPIFARRAPFNLLAALLAVLGVAAVTACSRPDAVVHHDRTEELMKKGYSPAPVVLKVSQTAPDKVVIDGQALPEGRVRFLCGLDGQQRAIGLTADDKGHFSAELPTGPNGNVFDLSMENSGSLMHAEGRLFVPPNQPGKAVFMRPGAPSLPLVSQGGGLAIVDYDSAGAFAVVGRVAPRAPVNLIVDGEVRARTTSDANGMFSAVTQVAMPGQSQATVKVEADAAGASWHRDVQISAPTTQVDTASQMGDGWRVDWRLPGGGMQTTLIF